jgi:3-hydroxyacyl-CoA dehydrogenase
MKRKIKKVAVLGAGVMGTGIAAHLANVGIPCLMLDIVPPFLSDEEKKIQAKRNMFAASGLKAALKAKPALFFTKSGGSMITIGNFEDDLHRVSECDWIIEVVKEDLAIKQGLFKEIVKHRTAGTIVTSNTSGLSIESMTEGMTEEFCNHFMVTHFFNPVRYMKLLELVVGPKSDPEVVEDLAEFGEMVLGKGIVYGKDTPNFVANRIGIHAVMSGLSVMQEMGLTVEAIDAIAGPPMGRPKSAVFRTIDLVGLDTFASVSQNVYDNCPNDEERDVFQIPEFVQKMLEKKWLGNKTRGGFYKIDKSTGKKVIYALDLNSVEYREKEKVAFESIKAVKGLDTTAEKIASIVYADDDAGLFAWKTAARSLVYAANRLGEIADDIVNIDRGMRWGFNWELGPFQTWDAIGVAKSVSRMEEEGISVPQKIRDFLGKSEGTFYKTVAGEEFYWDFTADEYAKVPVRDSWMTLGACRAKGSKVDGNDSATIHDLGDGCLGLEFHSRMNAIDDDIIRMQWRLLELLEESKWEGGVIYNEGTQFSVGANLVLINMYAMQKKWDDIEMIVDQFQKVNTATHRGAKPVVAAPHQMALGGGCEVCLGASHIVAHAELYMGLVEVGVGLIPGGGGTKELLVRWMREIPEVLADTTNPLPYFQKVFEYIGTAGVSFSARLAEEMRLLRPGLDKYVPSRDNQLNQAKQYALGLSRSGWRPEPAMQIPATGTDGIALAEAGLYTFTLGGYATEYDAFIGRKLAYVLAGGDVLPGTIVTEERILELEKEAFMSLLGEKKTMARIRHILMTNKPLRN